MEILCKTPLHAGSVSLLDLWFMRLPLQGRTSPGPAYICRASWSSSHLFCSQRRNGSGWVPVQACDLSGISFAGLTGSSPLHYGNDSSFGIPLSFAASVAQPVSSHLRIPSFGIPVWRFWDGTAFYMDNPYSALWRRTPYIARYSGYNCSFWVHNRPDISRLFAHPHWIQTQPGDLPFHGR